MQNSLPDKEGKAGDYREGDGPGPTKKRTGNDAGRRELLKYAGLSSQVAASVGIAVFIGIKADKWLKVSFPIVSWGLPLLVIVVLIIKLIKAGSGKNDGK
jgi:hypothetical protein